MTNTISERLKEAIKNSKCSYYELEKKTGIPKSAIQRYATGNTDKLPADRIEKIAKATGCPLSYILGTEETVEFHNAEEALSFLLKNPVMMAYGGYDVNSMNEEELTALAKQSLDYITFLTKYRQNK